MPNIAHYGFVIDRTLVRYIDVPTEINRANKKKLFRATGKTTGDQKYLHKKIFTDAAIEKERKKWNLVWKNKKEKWKLPFNKNVCKPILL